MTQPSRIDGLPDLPKPITNMLVGDDWQDVFDTDQMDAHYLKGYEAGSAAAAQAAKQVPAGRSAILEEAARACEKLAEERFNDHGTREPDTGACYYGGRVEEEYQTRDEEDDECAKAIRALAATPASPQAPAPQAVVGEAKPQPRWYTGEQES